MKVALFMVLNEFEKYFWCVNELNHNLNIVCLGHNKN